MNADAYQTAAARTLINEPQHEIPGHDMMLVWVALGLTGEAGEVAEHVKKGVLHQHGVDREKLVKELGDVAWYLAGLATLIGVPLSEVMERNITKLKTRYPNGYASADSKARVDVAPNPPQLSGRKADILSALQYYGPLTARQLENKLNKPASLLTGYLTSMYRNGEVTRELVEQDDTNRRYYRYTAYGADCQPITRGATPLIRG